MIDFLLIAFLLLIISCSGKILATFYHSKVYLKLTYWIQVGILMSLSMFRDYSIGNDTIKYVEFYEQSSFDLSRFEPGFIFLVRVCKAINPDPRFFLCLTSIFIFYSFGITIWRYSKLPSFSLYIIYCYTFFNFALSGLRESLAISLILLSYPYLIERKNYKFLLMVAIACSMHVTACIFLLSFVLIRAHVSKRIIFLMFCCGIVLQSLFASVLDYAILLIPAYNSYIGGDYFGDTRLASILDIGVLLCVFFYCWIIYQHLNRNKYDNSFFMLIGFSIVIMIISFQFNLLSRLALYYSFFIAILLPNAICKTRGKLKAISCTLVLSFFTLYNVIILLLRPEWNSTFPYKFFFL